ncbi:MULTISPECIES: YheT family hydrolase [Eikenella]|uniref:Alpha/beta hydrolase n=1 Tax=Eikenella longinqua TaxID=1795827 RepID=A0A1A9RV40_9NEIS|nr:MULTISPECIES: alpha/beta fold hydrolase [Eikenella]OAM26919.1 alpha/beta hydrolase [Eikenella longinqua]
MTQNLANCLPAYHPPVWLRGGHMQSIWPKLVRIGSPAYRRELLPDSRGETEVAYDFADGSRADAPLLMLFHGLEGGSESHYARALMLAAQRQGWHGVVAHFRSCGGVENRARVFYHSGDTAEVAHMLGLMAARYARVYAVGISLGGNALAKYLAEQGAAAIPQAAAVVSAPLDLIAASRRLEQGLSKMLYAPYFLRSLLPKAAASAARFPQIDAAAVQASANLTDFDNAFTAPLHGFADAADYYRRASAKPLLRQIAVPTLILNARNDPFIPAYSLPDAGDVSAAVTLLQPEYGGHAGFPGRADLDWLPDTVLRYFDLAAPAE